MKSKDQLFHELIVLVCRMRVILWEIEEDNRPDDIGRELAILTRANELLRESEPFIPTSEQLKEWENESHRRTWQTNPIPESDVSVSSQGDSRSTTAKE